MKKSLIRIPVLIIPAFFAYLGFFYQDFLYFGLSLFSFIFSLIVIFPNFLSKRNLNLPTLKNIKASVGNKQIKNRKKFEPKLYVVLFLLSLAIYTLIFIIISIFKLNNDESKNIIFTYFINQIGFLYSLKIISFVGILIFVLSTFVVLNKGFKRIEIDKAARTILISIGINATSFLLGLVLALILIFVIGFAQLNFISLSSRIAPQLTGIISDKKVIVEKLKSLKAAPAIIPLSSGKNLSIFINTNPTSNSFYLKSVLVNIPSFLILPFKMPNENFFMIKNNLVIKEINLQEIELISPYIGKLLVKDYFKSRFIKEYPDVKVIGRQEYLDYRIKEINKELDKIDEYISEIKSVLSSNYGLIQKAKNNIALWQSIIQNSISQKDSEYKDCISAGYYSYYFGTFSRYYTDSYCRGLGAKWDNYINEANDGIKINNENISYYQSRVKLWNENLDYFETARSLKANSKTQTPQELGIFEPEKQIRIAIDETSSNKIVDYLGTLSHEYLHYSSYVNDEQTLLPFFEEGLTEYYSREAIYKSLKIKTNMGYPLYVAIIKQVIKKIPTRDLEELYFKKDQKMLEALLNNAYGENFYNDYELYFSVISYMPQREALSMSNAIMLKVGGHPLTESDIYSSEANSN